MNELIWYSVPGGIILLSIVVGVDPAFFEHKSALIGIASAPLIGFIVHQIFRTIFELLGGFASRHRHVIGVLKGKYPKLKSRDAFIVWETIFYSQEMSEAFRDHDRGAWHYIMSFWGVTLACFISICILWFKPCSSVIRWTGNINWIWLFIIIGVFFFIKGKLTEKSIGWQEAAVVKSMERNFNNMVSILYP